MTKESLLAAQPCYNENQLNELPIPPDGATPQQIASYNEIPVKDRIWALCYALNVGKAQKAQFDKILFTFACDVTEDAFQRAKTAPIEYKQLIDITRKFLNSEATKDEVNNAIRNVDKVYNSNYWDANYAAYCAAYGTFYDAVYSTHNSAAGWAYYAAYNNAACNNQKLFKKYLDMLVERLS